MPLPFGAARRGGCAIEADDTVDPTIDPTVEPARLYPAEGNGNAASGVPFAWKNLASDLSLLSDFPILEAPDEYPETALPDALLELPLAWRNPDFWCASGRGLVGGAGEALTSLA